MPLAAMPDPILESSSLSRCTALVSANPPTLFTLFPAALRLGPDDRGEARLELHVTELVRKGGLEGL
jgi:hypothetical protein